MDPATFHTDFNVDIDTITRTADRELADEFFDMVVMRHKFSVDMMEECIKVKTDNQKKYVIDVPPGIYHAGVVFAVANGCLKHVLCGVADKFTSGDIRASSKQALRSLCSDQGLHQQLYGLPFCASTLIHRKLWRALSNTVVPFVETLRLGENYVLIGLEEVVTSAVQHNILLAAEAEVQHLTGDMSLRVLPGARHGIQLAAIKQDRSTMFTYESSLPITTMLVTLTGTSSRILSGRTANTLHCSMHNHNFHAVCR